MNLELVRELFAHLRRWEGLHGVHLVEHHEDRRVDLPPACLVVAVVLLPPCCFSPGCCCGLLSPSLSDSVMAVLSSSGGAFHRWLDGRHARLSVRSSSDTSQAVQAPGVREGQCQWRLRGGRVFETAMVGQRVWPRSRGLGPRSRALGATRPPSGLAPQRTPAARGCAGREHVGENVLQSTSHRCEEEKDDTAGRRGQKLTERLRTSGTSGAEERQLRPVFVLARPKPCPKSIGSSKSERREWKASRGMKSMTLPLTSYRGLASAAGGCSRPFVNRAEPVRLVCVCVCLSNYVLCVCVCRTTVDGTGTCMYGARRSASPRPTDLR